MGNVAYTYDDKANREDLLDVLTNLSPIDTQLITGLASGSADAIRTEWLEDTLSAVKVNAFVEGADASYHNLTNPSRLFNYTQIFRQGYKVTDTERAVSTAAFNDRYAYEATKAMKMLKADMEFAAMRGTLACGSTTAVRTLKGVKAWMSLVTSQSGVSLTEKTLNDYFQDVWNQGTEVNALYTHMYIKRKIAGFTGAATQKNVAVDDRRLVNAVDVYQADAASMVKLFAHRYVTITGDVNYDIVGMNEEMFETAYLRNPQQVDRPKTGDATPGEIITEATIRCKSGWAGFLAKAHL